MLRYGIPSYRFPREKLDAEIESILSLGIEVHTGVTVGRDIWLEKLEQEYDCIYIAIGAAPSDWGPTRSPASIAAVRRT